jgi:CheY-like chemotaxis protein
LLDIGLEGLSGIEVARSIKKDERCAHCILIAMTGANSKKVRDDIDYSKFNFHLVKPTRFPKTLAIIEEQLQQRKTSRPKSDVST